MEQPASKENKENYQSKISTEGSFASVSCLKAPAEGFVSADNSGEGFFSKGWVFNSKWLFDTDKLHALIHGFEAERLKGVFITPDGMFGFNKADSAVTKTSLQDSFENQPDSRVEVISNRSDIFDDIEEGLLNCLVKKASGLASLVEPALNL